jgi:hypothetical protein
MMSHQEYLRVSTTGLEERDNWKTGIEQQPTGVCNSCGHARKYHIQGGCVKIIGSRPSPYWHGEQEAVLCSCGSSGAQQPTDTERLDWAKQAAVIRRAYFPWDEYPHIAAPGGVADQMERAILIALGDAYRAGHDAAMRGENKL